jgi:hypothetical protein
MLQDVLVGLREELRQILDLDHQTWKALRHARETKTARRGRKVRTVLIDMPAKLAGEHYPKV